MNYYIIRLKSLKFLHLADSHIGRRHGLMRSVKGRNLMAIDAENQFKLMMDMAVEEGVDFVLHSGDLFDSSSISKSDMLNCMRTLKNLRKQNIPFIVIRGNHDRNRGSNISPMDFIGRLSNVYVINKPSCIILRELQISLHGVPYLGRKSISSFSEIQKSLLNQKEKHPILLLHQSIEEFDLGFDPRRSNEPFINKAMIDQQFNYVALGHIHINQFQRHHLNSDQLMHYPGSPFITNFKERNDKKSATFIELSDKNVDYYEYKLPSRDFMEVMVYLDNQNNSEIISQIEDILDKHSHPERFLGIRVLGNLENNKKDLLRPVHYEYLSRFAGMNIYHNQIKWLTDRQLKINC